MSRGLILAVDGGSTKTDVALVSAAGTVLGAARGPGIPYADIGIEAAIARLDATVAACSAGGRAADQGVYCLPGIDRRAAAHVIGEALARRDWARRTLLRNDTFAVLRAGTAGGIGVAVVCGTGLNCLGLSANGRVVRFPALGWISGDLGCGYELGKRALGAAVRARDGRGPRTDLERLVSGHFSLARPDTVVRAIEAGRIRRGRVAELAPLVLAAAEMGDRAASEIVDAVVAEVGSLAGATLRRLRLLRSDADVVLGGGVARNDLFFGRARNAIAAIAPRARIARLEAPPVLGAALLGLDAVGSTPAAARRLRASLTEARLEGS